jgi:hypothetical protein
VKSIRNHLSAIGIVWLMFQAGVLAGSPFVSCCAAASQTEDEDDCCKGMAPGQICPLHKHRHAPKPDPQQDHSSSRCAISSGCPTPEPALLSLAFGLGVIPAPVSLAVISVSNPVHAVASHVVTQAHSLDPPPPRL